MIGSEVLPFKGYDLARSGLSSSDYAADGGLSPNIFRTTAINPFVTPGVIYPTVAATDASTNVADTFIASCEDSNATSPNNRYFVGDAGNFYSFNGTTITKVKTASDTTQYVMGKTDFISFAGYFYATRTGYLVKWDGTSGAGLTETFKTFSDGSAHHPMIVFEQLLWVADGNTLSTLASDGTTYSTSVLALDSKEKIVALGIDPSTGLMLISVQTVYDVSDTIPSLKVVYLFNGYSPKPSRKILVEDLVTGFINVGGTVYVGYGQSVGYWTGSGVAFLRKLQNVGLDNTQLAYKHHLSSWRTVLLVVDGTQVLGYGEVIQGQRRWFPIIGNSANIGLLAPVGSNKIAIAYATTTFVTFDLTSVASCNSNRAGIPYVFFPRPVYIRRIRVITTGCTSNSTVMTMTALDETGTGLAISSANKTPAAVGGKYIFDFDYGSAKCQALQWYILWGTTVFGIISVDVYYDPAE